MAKLTLVVEAFIGLYVFGLAVELIMLPMLALMAAMSVVAGSRDDLLPVKRMTDLLLGIAGIGLITFSVVQLAVDWSTLDKNSLWRALGLPVWLTLGLMPYLYIVGLWTSYEGAFLSINHETKDRAARRRAKLGLVLALHFRASQAIDFRAYWARKIAQAETMREARDVGLEFLQDRQRRAQEVREAEARLERYAGVDGVDEDGQRLDQREFAETKEALQRLATMQMGWYRNRGGSHRPDLLDLLRSNGLPEEHGIGLSVTPDGQSWWAWRRTVSGWCFAIGAAEEPPDQWLYDGLNPPSGFPAQDPAWGTGSGFDAMNW